MAPRREHLHKVTGVAGAAILRRRILKYGSADGVYIQATGSTDFLVGVSDDAGDIPTPTAATPERVDCIDDGYALVDYGGTITRGQYVTSDANGKAIAAAPANGVNAYVVGQAQSSGSNGSVGSIKIQPCIIQG